MPQLDALRFFAVLGVLVSHYWIPKGLFWLFADMDWGWIGVHLFFVLSGFLITAILLRCRYIAENTSQSPLYFIRQFYLRRFLRIFPIYYLVIGIALVLNLPLAREIWGWLVSYTANIYIVVFNRWIGLFSHFWSLAVEEQFYLFWPWLILFLPKKSLAWTMLFVILLAPIYRFSAYEIHRFNISPFDFKSGTLTLGNLDSLGMGALLALVHQSKSNKEAIQKYLSRMVLPFGLFLYTISLALYHYHIKPSVFFSLNDFAVSLIFTWLVSAAAIGFKNALGNILEFSPLKYLGKISYGIYVYHYFIPFFLASIFGFFKIEYHTPSFTNFLLASVVSIAVATLSWHIFEFPINNLKAYFRYNDTANMIFQPSDEARIGKSH
jgi:peptidoglycan/LPS O-acetylase OafA/YrhL